MAQDRRDTPTTAALGSGRRPRRAGGRRLRTVLLATALVLGATAPVQAVPALAPSTARAAAPGAERNPHEPPYAGQLTRDLLARMQRLRIPGAIVSVTTPEAGTWTTALGTRDLTTGEPLRTDDHLRVGSITKTFTGTVVLQLVQEGRLSLDDPVATYRQGVPNGERITIRQLLQMTSGLYNYAEDPGFNERIDRDPAGEWTPEELLDVAFRHPVYFPPGTAFHYSNTNTVLLGLIAERLTHRPLAELFRRRIFRPLGLRETGYHPSAAFPRPHPAGYQFISNVDSLSAPVLTGRDAAWADWSAGNPYDATGANLSWGGAAGAAVSTVDDLRRWARALATGTLLSPELQRERLTFVPASDRPDAPGYGLAVANLLGFIGHDGQIPGFTGFMGYDPARRATLVVLANLNQSPDGTAPANELAKVVVTELFAH
ncbi:serine hydrolase domain-containing protein [Streptomyces phaeofaciens]|uniref:serine hydrolase domain-containing protein n=1 Tax=Streptomyces phaeofaciens TaxID=68254 RepID=UPI003691B878